jgi:hypothetical protein
MSVSGYVRSIAKSMEDGDTNPHIVLRDILGEVYAQGFHEGFASCLSDRTLDES